MKFYVPGFSLAEPCCCRRVGVNQGMKDSLSLFLCVCMCVCLSVSPPPQTTGPFKQVKVNFFKKKKRELQNDVDEFLFLLNETPIENACLPVAEYPAQAALRWRWNLPPAHQVLSPLPVSAWCHHLHFSRAPRMEQDFSLHLHIQV